MIKRLALFSSITATGLMSAAVIAMPQPAQAADVLKDVCSRKTNAAVCKDNNPNPGDNNPLFGSDGIITEVVNIISLLVGIAAVIMIIMAGLKLITSGSNPQEVAKGREMIVYAAIGLIVAASAQLLVRFILFEIFKPPT
jgi:hypothetical protein